MAWQPDIGREIARRALEEHRRRGQTSTNKPALPKPVSSGTRQSLTQGAIRLMEEEKQKRGIGITRQAMGLENTDPQNGVVTAFDKDAFKSNIIRDSIKSNLLTGGRHPKAAPLKSKGGGGGGGGGGSDKPKTDNSGGGRQTTTRVNSNNVKQTGTDMSARIFGVTMDDAQRLAGRGIADITKFQSEALPNTEAGQRQLRMQKEEEMLASGDYARISGGKNAGKIVDVRSSNKDFDKIVSGAIAAPEISLGVQKGSSPVADRTEQSRAIEFDDAVDDRFADGAEYGNDYVSDISPQRLRARAAFLNAENSLDGLRGAEAEMGYFAQGGKKFANVGGELQEVTKEGYSKGMSGGVTANELKDYYVKEVSKQVKEEESPSPSREQQPNFLPDDENMLTFANSGEQKLLSDMTEEDWERANKLPSEM